MEDSPETFTVTLNFSKVLSQEELFFTMFIDNTKMTIVYELIEWIRWVFSLEKCIYLCHENSRIHELEDIRILSLLKILELRPCKPKDCIHQENYKIFLSNLDFFILWNQMKVPKLFVCKYNKMQAKLCNKIEKKEDKIANQSTIPNKSIPTIVSNTNDYRHPLLDSLQKTQDELKNKCHNDNEVFSTQEKSVQNKEINNFDPLILGKMISSNNGCSKTIPNKFLGVNDNSTIGNDNSLNKDIVRECLINDTRFIMPSLPDRNKNKTESSLKISNEETAEIILPIKSENTKSKRPKLKPFSLSELLTNLRSQSESEHITNTLSHHEKKLNVDEDMLDTTTAKKKKRKRIRRPKTRKRKAETENKIALSAEFINDKPYYEANQASNTSEPKPSHIRFDSLSEDEQSMESLGEEPPSIKENIDLKLFSSFNEGIESEKEIKNILPMEYELEKSENVNYFEKQTSISESEIIAVDERSPKSCVSTRSLDPSLSKLLNKYISPLVFERFN